jgi:hypothetical protein
MESHFPLARGVSPCINLTQFGKLEFGIRNKYSFCPSFTSHPCTISSLSRNHGLRIPVQEVPLVIRAVEDDMRKVVFLLVGFFFLSLFSFPQAQQPRLSHGFPHWQPVSLAHLYWHFLAYQNHLDTEAAAKVTQGQDGSGLRNHLQVRMGFSDADYAPIRISSARLAAELTPLNAQAAEIRSAGPSSANSAQMQALTVQREAAINAEISYLKQTLSPAKIMAFEAFITQLFSPANGVFHAPPSTGQTAPAAVQQ